MDGYICYKLIKKQSFYPFDNSRIVSFYSIYRISPQGDVMESVLAQTDYPKEFSVVGGGSYAVFVRQN